VVKRAAALSSDEIYAVLDEVKDPEVPVLSVVELGIIRGVESTDDGVVVTVTPTYSGCPAMRAIEEDITRALHEHGVQNVEVKTVFTPAWTTDWIPAPAREKLRAYGIAPPGMSDPEPPLVSIGRRRPAVRCPYCGSMRTEMKSEFGSTACKSIHACRDCRQPFEEFKAI
jgi:ring-1,2-phenylacetyl-CoA epoxidase subunit PaaD